MTTILYSNNDIDENHIYLDEPKRIKGGAFYSKIYYKDKPLHLQTTICTNKNGMIETNKKKYIDLLFNDNKNSIMWIENLETILKRKIREKNNEWFSNSMEEEDIEDFFNSSFRRYKNNSYLVRTYIKEPPYQISIFDENEKEISIKEIDKRNMISIIHFDGIKFTNTTLLINIYIKQILILEKEEEKQHKCMINKKVIFSNNTSDNEKEENDRQENFNTEEQDKIKVIEEDIIQQSKNENTTEETIHHSKTNDKEEEKVMDIDKNISLEKVSKNDFTDELEEYTDKIVPLDNEAIKLKPPNKVMYDVYKNIRKKIRYAKKMVVEGYLEARRIKKLYLLDDLESDSSDEEENLDYLSDASTEELMEYNDKLNK